MASIGFERLQRAGGQRIVVRTLRLVTGLVLFAYAASHFINHAFGIRSPETMEAASTLLLRPWQTGPGLIALYGSLVVHGSLGLYALYRRRHLKIPASEKWQLALGLLIPLLLIPHATSIRVAHSLFGIDYTYANIVYQYWVNVPEEGLPRQFALLLVLWMHGCIGLRAWLRFRPWYRHAVGPLAALATIIPLLAILGLADSGLNVREAVSREPAAAARLALPQPDAHAAEARARLWVIDDLPFIYLGLVAGVVVLRAGRNWHAKRFRAVRISYPGQRAVTVPAGFSVLEASRWASIPHASACGGRGRCSTCRVRIHQGGGALAPPGPAEARTLQRIGAPADIRLACQIRPRHDLSVEPLVPAGDPTVGAERFGAVVTGGREMQVAAMFVDLRESTRLAAGRLPYDVLFLFDRYLQTVTGAIRGQSGHVTSVAGDGVMSIFGVDSKPAAAARCAFHAALNLWEGIDLLNGELAGEFESPLRVGIGLHVGPAVVSCIDGATTSPLQFLGDTGNVAARLEAETKSFACTLVVSLEALAWAAPGASVETRIVSVRGKDEPMQVAIFTDRAALERMLAAA